MLDDDLFTGASCVNNNYINIIYYARRNGGCCVTHVYSGCILYCRTKNRADPIPPRTTVSGRVPYTSLVDVPHHRILGNELTLKHYRVMTPPPYRARLYPSPARNHSAAVITYFISSLVVRGLAVGSEPR